jgi:hypothetical protein
VNIGRSKTKANFSLDWALQASFPLSILVDLTLKSKPHADVPVG